MENLGVILLENLGMILGMLSEQGIGMASLLHVMCTYSTQVLESIM